MSKNKNIFTQISQTCWSFVNFLHCVMKVLYFFSLDKVNLKYKKIDLIFKKKKNSRVITNKSNFSSLVIFFYKKIIIFFYIL